MRENLIQNGNLAHRIYIGALDQTSASVASTCWLPGDLSLLMQRATAGPSRKVTYAGVDVAGQLGLPAEFQTALSLKCSTNMTTAEANYAVFRAKVGGPTLRALCGQQADFSVYLKTATADRRVRLLARLNNGSTTQVLKEQEVSVTPVWGRRGFSIPVPSLPFNAIVDDSVSLELLVVVDDHQAVFASAPVTATYLGDTVYAAGFSLEQITGTPAPRRGPVEIKCTPPWTAQTVTGGSAIAASLIPGNDDEEFLAFSLDAPASVALPVDSDSSSFRCGVDLTLNGAQLEARFELYNMSSGDKDISTNPITLVLH